RIDVACIDTTGRLTNWNPAMNESLGVFHHVTQILVKGASVYIAGHFTRMGSRWRTNLAVVDTTSGLATAIDPYTDTTQTVNSLGLSGSTLVVGGTFRYFVGQQRGPVAAFD